MALITNQGQGANTLRFLDFFGAYDRVSGIEYDSTLIVLSSRDSNECIQTRRRALENTFTTSHQKIFPSSDRYIPTQQTGNLDSCELAVLRLSDLLCRRPSHRQTFNPLALLAYIPRPKVPAYHKYVFGFYDLPSGRLFLRRYLPMCSREKDLGSDNPWKVR